jgi:hypothetical protein
MKALSDKTGVPEEHLKTLMDKGVISCSWEGYEEVYYHYKSLKDSGISQEQAMSQTSVDKNVSRSHVWNVIKKFE